ncbi:hypothetical protein [Gehongia tenuis]|uniref:Uncharacterized protein n=1 Tax=Gehongia tenuis TaxID=2763655 RepID=A0A926D7V1_9FIRM|nr:hypothetical protein [Gehongia tenuis]MBC8531990.1 hypothetical protein [Gehongia tenuis]
MRFIQIGVTAARDPKTGEFLPAVPIYVKATEELAQGEEKLHQNIGKLLAEKMRQYVEGGGMMCKEGVD